MRSIIIVVLTLLLFSCRTTKGVSDSTNKASVIRETVRDSIGQIPPDSSMIRALLACDSLGNVYLKQIQDYRSGANLMPPTIEIKDNQLTSKASTPQKEVHIPVKETYRSDSYTRTIRTTITIKENYITGWQWFQIWCGRIFMCMAVIYIGWKIVKSKLKWLQLLNRGNA